MLPFKAPFAISPFMNRFGDLLDQIIKNSGKSLRENAIEWKWVHSHLSRIVTGRLPPRTPTVARACRLVDAATGKKLIEAYLADERERIDSLMEPLRSACESRPVFQRAAFTLAMTEVCAVLAPSLSCPATVTSG